MHMGPTHCTFLLTLTLTPTLTLAITLTLAHPHRVAGVDAEQDLPEDVARLGLLEAAVRHDEVEELATAHLLRGRGRDGARARAGARIRGGAVELGSMAEHHQCLDGGGEVGRVRAAEERVQLTWLGAG